MPGAVKLGDYTAAIIMLLFLIAGFVHLMFPPSYWIEARSVIVEDGTAGQPLILRVDREVKRSFRGRYNVYIRSLPGQTAYCEADGEIYYRPDAELPDPVTMEWWAYNDPRCHGANIKPGSYSMKTCWTIQLPLWFSRYSCTESPTFLISQTPQGAPDDA